MVSLLLQLTVASAAAAPGPPPDRASGRSYRGADADIVVETPSLADAHISVDGRLDEEAWAEAAVLRDFTQYDPVEGAPASQRTEVLVIVDDDAIFFGIRAYDDDPSGIRATMAERDSYARSDDYVRIVLDTFDDQRRAYVFTVNPLGVQHDGIWNEGGASTGRRGAGGGGGGAGGGGGGGGGGGNFGDPIDDNPDFLWDSDAGLTEWGYLAEVRIPFKTLRFPAKAEQSWGLQVTRRVQRTGYQSAWAPVTKNGANRLAQSGKLTGLRDLNPGLFMEVNPVGTASRTGAYDETTGVFTRESPDASFGLNATYGVTTNLTLDATYNPDFSQVEADAGQISVNERFALFFPEKRPFFLEGTEIFGMPRQLVYTRSIANPLAGAKLTGKVGSLNVGYLGAVDESFDSGEPSTVVNLVRLRQDVGASSTVGAVYTDRTVDAGEYNRVVGGDARLLFGRRHTLTLLGATSFTDTSDPTPREVGRLLYGRFEQAGRTFTFNGEFEDTDAGFDAQSGFFNRIGDAQVQGHVAYNWFGAPGAMVEQVGPSVDVHGYWDHDAFWAGQGLQEGDVRTTLRVSLKDNITVWGNFAHNVYSFSPDLYDGLFVEQAPGTTTPFAPDPSLFDGMNALTLSLYVSKWQRVRGNIRYTFSRTPIFDRRYDVPVGPARSRSMNLMLNLYPTRALSAEVGVNQTRLERVSDGVEHSTAIIPRVQAQYQFTRALFVRGIFEYSNQESLALVDPVTGLPLVACDGTTCDPRAGSDGHDFHVESLVSYEPSPGTVFYVGYTRQMEDTGAFRFRNVQATADGLFVKLSYRFRM